MSALPRFADFGRTSREVREVPILLQKSAIRSVGSAEELALLAGGAHTAYCAAAREAFDEFARGNESAHTRQSNPRGHRPGLAVGSVAALPAPRPNR
jgi:hypothetical protein